MYHTVSTDARVISGSDSEPFGVCLYTGHVTINSFDTQSNIIADLKTNVKTCTREAFIQRSCLLKSRGLTVYYFAVYGEYCCIHYLAFNTRCALPS